MSDRSSLPASLESKLAAYSAAAGAALLALTPATAEAQIVYTDVDPDVSLATGEDYAIDFDGDGLTDVLFQLDSPFAGFTRARVIADEARNGGISGFGPVTTNYNYFYASVLDGGTAIDGSTTIDNSNTDRDDFLLTSEFNGVPYGNWAGETDKYVGVRFQAGGGTTHYAWVRLDVTDSQNITVEEYAFQGTPDTGILAGDTSGEPPPPPPPPPEGEYDEEGDAGIFTDGMTGDARGATTSISGELTAGDTADCYTISIADVDAFSATTENAESTGADTQLRLFTASGEGVIKNDDTPDAPGLLSTIAAGSLSGMGLEAGDYIICNTEWDVRAQNAAGEDIFDEGDFTGTVTPSAASGDFTLAIWNEVNAVNGFSYQIDLTGTGGDTPPPPGGDIAFDSINLNGTTLPSDGGFIRYKIQIDNDGMDDASVDIWATVQDASGTTLIYVRRPRTFTVPGESRIRSGYNQRIPDYVPDGTYIYTIFAGDYNEADPSDNSGAAGSEVYSVTKGAATLVSRDRDMQVKYLHEAQASGTSTSLVATRRSKDGPMAQEKAVDAAHSEASHWQDNEFVDIEVISLGTSNALAIADGDVTVGPNPVRNQAEIRFGLAADADVSLAVYDLLGREVAGLVDGHLEAGSHSATLDASALPAGTYVYRLTVGTEVQSGRLTVVR